MIACDSHSAQDTERNAAALARVARAGIYIGLHGELGSGKTTWARGFLHGMGYPGTVRSPTYTLVEPYDCQGCTVYHFDLYRVREPRELEQLGYRDYFNEEAICLVEWPERAAGLLGVPDLRVDFQGRGSTRWVSFVPETDAGRNILDIFRPSERNRI